MSRTSTKEALRRLQTITDAALSSLEIEDLLQELLERTCDLLSADTAAILLVDDQGQELVATASIGLEEEVRQGLRVPLGAGFAGRIAAEATAATLDQITAESVVSQVVIDKHLAAMAGVPIIADGVVAGVLHVGSTRPRTFGDDDIDLLRLVADRASLALRARLSRLDRSATLALQRSLLPDRLTRIPGFDVAARYIPGAAVGVGGDWYDMFTLPSGHIGVVIGDVVGNGLRAAVVMGRIRSALRAYALETPDPADVLRRLDRKIQLFEPDAMATALYAVIDPSDDSVALSSAGHPPPILLDESKAVGLLEVPPDLPLGAHAGAPRRTTTVDLPRRAGLFCYTDGLVERHGVPIRDRISELESSLRGATADELCQRSTACLLTGQPVSDDVALIAIRRLPEG